MTTKNRISASAFPIRNPRHEARVLLALAGAYVGIAAMVGLLIREWPLPILGVTRFTNDAWYVLLFKIGTMLILPLYIFLRRWGNPFSALWFPWSPSLKRWLWVAVALITGLALNLLQHFPALLSALRTTSAPQAAVLILFGAVLPLVSAALPEEIMFRRLLQTRLELVWGRLAAVAATALLFTAWHIPSRYLLASGVEGQAGDLQSVLMGTGIPVLTVGLALGFIWDRWRNLPALIALHWGIDIVPSICSFLGIRF